MATQKEEAVMREWLESYEAMPKEKRTATDDKTARNIRRMLRGRRPTPDGMHGFPWWRDKEKALNVVYTGNGNILCPTNDIATLVEHLPDVYQALADYFKDQGALRVGQLLVKAGFLTQAEAELENDEMPNVD